MAWTTPKRLLIAFESMYTNIPKNALPRVLIVGGGFAGLKLAQSLDRKRFQIVLVDRGITITSSLR